MDYIVFLIAAPIAAFATLVTAGVVWHYNRMALGRALLLYLFLVAGLLIGNTSELLATERGATLFFGKLDHIFIQFIPVAWLAFAFAYSGRSELVRFSRLWVVCLVPLLAVVGAWTNELHGLFWREIRFFARAGYLTFKGEYGPLFWVGGAHSYMLLLAGAALILGTHYGGKSIYRNQSILVSAGALVPLLFNILYVFRVFPGVAKDFTPTAFALAGLAFFVGIFRYRLLQVVPVARSNVVDEMEMSVLVLDREMRIVDLNPAAAELFRVSDEDLGTNAGDHPAVEQFLNLDQLPGAKSRDVTIVEDGKTRYFDVRISPITERRRRWIGLLVTVAEVTERVELLHERERVVGELEETYTKLNETHLRLIHREKLASIGQMAAGLAHELNNPLGYLKSNIRALDEMGRELIEMGTLDERRREDLESILKDSNEAITRMTGVVRGLLSFSHGGAGTQKEPYSLTEGIESTLEMARSSYRDHARIVRQLGDVPLIVCNHSEINLVLLNLITNAGQAIAAASGDSTHSKLPGRITIRTYATENSVVCEISNNIPAINAGDAANLFEPFFTTKVGEGIGLGLSISRDIVVQRHGGSLDLVDTDPPTFRMILPVDTAEGTARPADNPESKEG